MTNKTPEHISSGVFSSDEFGLLEKQDELYYNVAVLEIRLLVGWKLPFYVVDILMSKIKPLTPVL